LNLSGRQIEQFRDALASAFDEGGLQEMLMFKLGKRLDHLVYARADLKTVCFQLIQVAKNEGWLTDLARAAAEARPRNQQLVRFVAENFREASVEGAVSRGHEAHHYFLLTAPRGLVGRKKELKLLDLWLGGPPAADSRDAIMVLVAIGGAGKSALAWHWFENRAEAAAPEKLADRVWWSFYEKDSTYPEFLRRALVQADGLSHEAVLSLPVPEMEDALLKALDERPYLLVLDGFERQMIASSGLDSAHKPDEEWTRAERSSVRRTTVDLSAGRFLARLAQLRRSRVLMTTRLFPVALEGPTGVPIAGVHRHRLKGLKSDDALELWKAYCPADDARALKRLFRSFGYHPLLIQALAGTVANDVDHPGEFREWQRAHPDFDPRSLPLVQRRSHIIRTVMRGLSEQELFALRTVAFFQPKVESARLNGLLVGTSSRQVADPERMHEMLKGLCDHGLVAHETRSRHHVVGRETRRRHHVWDLHPVVRGVVWHDCKGPDQDGVLANLERYFQAIPPPRADRMYSLDDLDAAREHFLVFFNQGRTREALELLKDRMLYPLQWLDGGHRMLAQMLDCIFPDGRPWSETLDHDVASTAGRAYRACGRPKKGLELLRHHGVSCMACHLNVARMELDSGELYESSRTVAGVLAWHSAWDPRVLTCTIGFLARLAHALGELELQRLSERLALRFLPFCHPWGIADPEILRFFPSDEQRELHYQRAMRAGDLTRAMFEAERLLRLAEASKHQPSIADAMLRHGVSLFELGRFDEAKARLHGALRLSLKLDLNGISCEAKLHQARIAWKTGQEKLAREYGDEAIEQAQASSLRRIEAETANLCAEIELETGNTKGAGRFAIQAYKLAYSDGPPFVLQEPLKAAQVLLARCGQPEPVLRPRQPGFGLLLTQIEGILRKDEEIGRDLDVRFRALDWRSLMGVLIAVGLYRIAKHRHISTSGLDGGFLDWDCPARVARDELRHLATFGAPPARSQSLAGLAALDQSEKARADSLTECHAVDSYLIEEDGTLFFAHKTRARRDDDDSDLSEVERTLERKSDKLKFGETSVDPTEAERDLAFIVSCLQSQSGRVRSKAQFQLFCLGDAAAPAVPSLVKLFDHTDAEIVSAAARILSSIGEAAAPAVPRLIELLRHTDPDVRTYSAYALVGNAHSVDHQLKLTPGLVELPKDRDADVRGSDPDVRSRSAYVLLGKGDAAFLAIAHLRELLKDPEAGVRSAAISALAEMEAIAVPTLLELLKDLDARVRFAAVDAWLRVVKDPEQAIPRLIELLEDSDGDVRAHVASALGLMRKEAAPAVPRLIQLFREATGHAQEHFARALGLIGESAAAAVPDLIDRLGDSDAHVRATVAVALALIGRAAAAAIPKLIALLRDENENTRESAAASLGLLGADAIAVLIETLNDTDLGARSAALEALGRLGPGAPSIQRIEWLLFATGPAEEVRQILAQALSSPTLAEKVPLGRLMMLIDNADPVVREAVAVILAERGGEALRAVLDALQDENLLPDALRALGSFRRHAEQVMPVLVEYMAPGNPVVQIAAIEATASLGTVAAPLAHELAHALTDRDPAVRTVAAAAMGSLKPLAPEHRDSLLKALEDPNESVRVAAVKSLKGVVGGPIAEKLLAAALRDDSGSVRRAVDEAFAGWPESMGGDELRLVGRTLSDMMSLSEKYHPELIEIAKRGDPAHRMAAMAALGRTIEPGGLVLEALISALDDPEMRIRVAAAQALAMLGSDAKRATEALSRRLSDREPEFRYAVADALIQIDPKNCPDYRTVIRGLSAG
jgi:HEAT repeat protein